MYFSDIWWQILLIAVCSYLFGNINWALLISRFKKTDVRKMGSGNPGTLNMSRNFGLKIGILTLVLDVFKGVIPTLVAVLLYKGKYYAGSDFELSDLVGYIAGLCVILGHIFPVFMKFKGGKGIASTIGVFAVEFPLLAFILVLVAFGYVYLTECGSMGSFIVITPLAIVELISMHVKYYGANVPVQLWLVTNLIIFLIMFFPYAAHRKNLVRLVDGTEHPTSIKQMLKKHREKKSQGAKEG